MASYNFSTLNDKDFEELARDLLSKELNIKLQNFKSGADKGIDLRYSSSSNKNYVVVQAKHYYKTGLRGLIRELKKEKEKVKQLKPQKYFIVTSVDLSPQNKDEIVNILKPYIKTSNNIFGSQDLNRMLQNYDDVEKKHFKLWLGSVAVLKKIFNNAVEGRSEFLKQKIKRNIKIYVQNTSLNSAVKILKKHKFILISGQPGVGKTTLAYILIYYFLAKDFELVFIDKSIADAEGSIHDINSKQIFYFDDFLGANYFEILNPKNSESSIINFIERIQNSRDKFLVLTTRTTVLNTAKQVYEKINQSDIEIGRKELELKDYNDYDKAKILYNHLYFSNLHLTYIKIIFQDENYWRIIKHKNYNPRLIEFITDKNRFVKSGYEKYKDFVFHNLDKPEELWKHSYENQIKDEDRFLIITLFSLGYSIDEEILEKAFEYKINFEIAANGFQKPNDVFNSILKRLLDGYINRIMISRDEYRISFVNPSINDFIISYLRKSKSERERLMQSLIYLEQVENVFISVVKDLSNVRLIHEINDLISILTKKEFLLFSVDKKVDHAMFKKFKRMVVYSELSLFEEIREKTDPLIFEILKTIDFTRMNYYKYLDFFEIIARKRGPNGMVDDFIRSNWDIIIEGLLNTLLVATDGEVLVEMFNEFEIDYDEYIISNSIGRSIRRFVEEMAEQETVDLIAYEEDDLKSDDDLENLKSKVREKREAIFNAFKLYDDYGWEEPYFDNLNEELFEKNRKSKFNGTSPLKTISGTDTNFTKKDIDDLFDISRLANK